MCVMSATPMLNYVFQNYMSVANAFLKKNGYIFKGLCQNYFCLPSEKKRKKKKEINLFPKFFAFREDSFSEGVRFAEKQIGPR